MTPSELHLDRVSLDGHVLRRLSATLHLEAGDRPPTSSCPWWAYLGCERIPSRYQVGSRSVRLRASLVSGREIEANAKIVGRSDDQYGTELILCGLEPLPSEDEGTSRSAQAVESD